MSHDNNISKASKMLDKLKKHKLPKTKVKIKINNNKNESSIIE